MPDAGADKLLEQRIILIDGPIEDKSATEVIARLLYLNHLDNKAPVRLLVNSHGGSLAAGMAILDTMDTIGPPILTCCTGNASGIALAVVAHGAKGLRTASAEAKFLFIPIWSLETGGKVENRLKKDRQVFIDLLVKDTKRKPSEVQTDMENERSLNAAEARAYGIIDSIEEK
jgi:ATP-dependent Clp protease protease subunit